FSHRGLSVSSEWRRSIGQTGGRSTSVQSKKAVGRESLAWNACSRKSSGILVISASLASVQYVGRIYPKSLIIANNPDYTVDQLPATTKQLLLYSLASSCQIRTMAQV